MDSYLYFYEIYSKYTRSRISRDIYSHATGLNKIGLWAGKMLFATFGIAQFFQSTPIPFFLAMLGSAVIWGISFDRTRKAYFAKTPELPQAPLKHFNSNYQYLRYYLFKEDVNAGDNKHAASAALQFLNNLTETEHKAPIFSHGSVSTLLAVLIAVVSATVSNWPLPVIAGVVIFTAVGIYFSAMFLSIRKTKEEDTKELKRYLLWLTSNV